MIWDLLDALAIFSIVHIFALGQIEIHGVVIKFISRWNFVALDSPQLLLGLGYYKKRIQASASLLPQETSVLVSKGAGYLFVNHFRRRPFRVPEVQYTRSLE
ncbi:hypothetical protein KFK09_026540 [Dendrobium nobile]|uniref:Uncharacterized protein n=1 Tax=Dendrobium nobile TaxID=94219 RepID=A0A8T3A8H3_DENNO|nr:hypothetical protein KFK09_026540 [Dendrobium nobile]